MNKLSRTRDSLFYPAHYRYHCSVTYVTNQWDRTLARIIHEEPEESKKQGDRVAWGVLERITVKA
jgi:hypothetical protein